MADTFSSGKLQKWIINLVSSVPLLPFAFFAIVSGNFKFVFLFTNGKFEPQMFCLHLRTSDDSNAGYKKVAKKVRIFAKVQKIICKYLFCPPVFFNMKLSIDTTFEND